MNSNKTLQFRSVNQVSSDIIKHYQQATIDSYPRFVVDSKIVQSYLPRLDDTFPDYQLLAFNEEDQLVGFFNTIPLQWNQELDALPHEGWDWLVQKAFSDHNAGLEVNILGAVQIIVLKEFLGKGLSKLLLARAKQLMRDRGLGSFILPIRPTLKHRFPLLSMAEYMAKQENNAPYDPWIRVHLNSGAKIIKVCSNSMNVQGDINYWENISGTRIDSSGPINIHGALNPILIDLIKDTGEYREENIWIYY